MTTKEEQKLIHKWIKIFSKLSTKDLLTKYEEDFKGRSTPRRMEDKAIKKAIECLLN